MQVSENFLYLHGILHEYNMSKGVVDELTDEQTDM